MFIINVCLLKRHFVRENLWGKSINKWKHIIILRTPTKIINEDLEITESDSDSNNETESDVDNNE